MAGRWLRTIEREQVAMVAGANIYDLPKSNFIGYVDICICGCGCATDTLLTIACDFTSVQIIGNSTAMLKDLTLRDARVVNIWDYGSAPAFFSSIVEATNTGISVRLDFGRWPHDELAVLPAKLFKQLTLRIVCTTIAGANLFDVAPLIMIEVEQYISADKPTEKLILKDSIIRTDAAAATTINADMPLGLWLKGVLMIIDEMTGNWYNILKVKVNNGAEIPWAGYMYNCFAHNVMESNVSMGAYVANGTVPSGAELIELTAELEDSAYMWIDFDPTRTLKDVLHTEVMNDLKVEIPRVASTADKVIAREIIALSGS